MNGECDVANVTFIFFLYKGLGFEYYQHTMFKCIFPLEWTWGTALVCRSAESSHIACKMPVNINVSSWHLPTHASQPSLDLLSNPNSSWWNHNATTRWQHLCYPLSPVYHTQVFFSTSVISQIQCKSVKPFSLAEMLPSLSGVYCERIAWAPPNPLQERGLPHWAAIWARWRDARSRREADAGCQCSCSKGSLGGLAWCREVAKVQTQKAKTHLGHKGA